MALPQSYPQPAMGLHAYPKAARLTKTDEFSSVFALRPVRRSRHFVLYVRANGHPQARLGVVIGKKFAKRAVERNLIKRQCRELFRLRQPSLGGRDVLIRLHAKFPRQDVLSHLFEIATRPLPAPPAPPAASQPAAGSTS